MDEAEYERRFGRKPPKDSLYDHCPDVAPRVDRPKREVQLPLARRRHTHLVDEAIVRKPERKRKYARKTSAYEGMVTGKRHRRVSMTEALFGRDEYLKQLRLRPPKGRRQAEARMKAAEMRETIRETVDDYLNDEAGRKCGWRTAYQIATQLGLSKAPRHLAYLTEYLRQDEDTFDYRSDTTVNGVRRRRVFWWPLPR